MTKPRYALDVSMAVRERPTGQARFIYESVKALDASDRASEFVIVVRRGADTSRLPQLKRIPVVRFGFGREIVWHQTFFPLYAAWHGLVPVSFSNAAPLLNVGIVTFHDITYKTCASSYRSFRGWLSMWWHRLQYWHCARHARRVLTVSEFSRQEYARVYGYPIDRIYTLFNGWEHMLSVGEDEGVFTRFPEIRRGEYYLVLGTLSEFKNIALAMRTAKKYPDTRWVVTGPALKTSSYSAEALPNVVWTGYLSDAEVKTLLKGAKALFFPSLSEGFGIPPLEALSVGTPAIVSRRSCLPCVYRNFVHWIDDPLAADPPHPETLLASPVEPPDALLAELSWTKIGSRLLSALDHCKVAVFVPRPMATGGVGICLRNYRRHLDPQAVRMDFFAPEVVPEPVIREIEATGGTVTRVRGVANLPLYLWQVYRLLRSGRYDIAHANMNTLSLPALFAAWLAGIPVRITHAHSASHPRERLRHVVKRALAPFSKLFATRLLACSHQAGTFQFGRRAMASGRVEVLPNAIDLDRYRFDPAARLSVRHEFGLDGKFVVGNVGRFVTQKNPLFMLEIFAALAKRREDAVLFLLGEGPLRGEIERCARELGLEGRVVMPGQRLDPWRYYNAFDAFCFPSIYEGLGLVLVEAQANGLACVTSTEVPREADMTGTVTFLPLSDSADRWADALAADAVKGSDRAADSAARCAAVRAAGYDIAEAAVRLASIYLGHHNSTGTVGIIR